MKRILLLLLVFVLGGKLFAQDDNKIVISGQVTDFEGNPIDSCAVILMQKKFNPAKMTFSDKTGHYKLQEVEKGRYIALLAIRLNEHPLSKRMFGVEPLTAENLRLEFWAWNVVADRDLTINPRYDRLELYGFRVFEVIGGSPFLMAYVRPMSMGKFLETGDIEDISPLKDDIQFQLFADKEPLAVRSIQTIEEYTGKDGKSQTAFIIQFDRPEKVTGDRCIFRIEATHKAFGGEKGENLFFHEWINYK
ncbi:Uncharacterised protein [Porphyromonas macacae]|uniref:Carboxypeptidase regulatory-like domain-containing protein n=1 Tax=Porphyromonas macacae TaxID=28115 RepID=A0A379EAU5_9PORP|nr:carboxypeptidase-like regulatory domain-containing protein [Porphyromonas macacae]SUB89649.1 Uncharacterised protein [Porphyromonas macacae]